MNADREREREREMLQTNNIIKMMNDDNKDDDDDDDNARSGLSKWLIVERHVELFGQPAGLLSL